MNPDRDVERILDRWLAEGPTEIADRAVHTALDLIDHTDQRRVIRVPWRTPTMTPLLRLAVAAALVAAVGGTLLVLKPFAQVGAPTQSASPAPTGAAASASNAAPVATPAPATDAPTRGPLPSGVTSLAENQGTIAGRTYTTTFMPAFTLDAGAGWYLLFDRPTVVSFAKGPNQPAGPDQETVQLAIPSRVVPAGGTRTAVPADLVGWLAARSDLVIASRRSVTVGGASGTLLEGSVASGVTTAGAMICGAASQCGTPDFAQVIGFGPGRTFRLYVLDVHGQQVVLAADADTSNWKAASALLDAFVRGLTFLPS